MLPRSTGLMTEFIAIDWGTTNRRIFCVASDGEILHTQRDDRGVLAMAGTGYDEEIAAIKSSYGDRPILCAGMIGSDRGWRMVPYVPAPAGLADLAAAISWVRPGVGIVPGVSLDNGPDIMRGEEVQLLGAVAAGMVPAESLLCQPGTHCKWAWMAQGRIARFHTAMTGELFALLRDHSLLSNMLAGDVSPGPAFLEGVAASAATALPIALFRARAAVVLGERAAQDTAAYVSGLLIGTDVRASLGGAPRVHVLADAAMGALYTAAIEALGSTAPLVDSHAAFLAGITRLWTLSQGASA